MGGIFFGICNFKKFGFKRPENHENSAFLLRASRSPQKPMDIHYNMVDHIKQSFFATHPLELNNNIVN